MLHGEEYVIYTLCYYTNDDVFNTLFWGDSGIFRNNVRSKPFFISLETFVLQLAQQQLQLQFLQSSTFFGRGFSEQLLEG